MYIDWNSLKRSTIYSPDPWLRRPSPRNYITPEEIFFEILRSNTKFLRLKGYSSWTLGTARDGSHFKRWFKSKQKTTPSDAYCFMDGEDRKAIVVIPSNYALENRVILHILWVPPHLGNRGIATAVMTELMQMTDHVDQLAKSGKRWKDKFINYESFSLQLSPTPFIVREGHWDIDLISKGKDRLDWTCRPDIPEAPEDAPDFKMQDETYKELPENERRLSLKQLRNFYIGKLGFVECSELAFDTSYDWETGRTRQQLNISRRSFNLARWPLMYPASNLEIYQREEDVIPRN